jgi:predicted esterase YcpF (UPF0227 family)
MKHYIYIHGFNSTTTEESTKYSILKEHAKRTGPRASYINYDSFSDAATISLNMAKEIEEIVDRFGTYNVILVGTSLGAFWALRMATAYNLKVIAINPVYAPFVDLTWFTLEKFQSFEGGEPVLWSYESHDSYRGLTALIRGAHTYGTRIIVSAKDDTLITNKSVLENFEGECVFTVEEGGHRLDGEYFSRYILPLL